MYLQLRPRGGAYLRLAGFWMADEEGSSAEQETTAAGCPVLVVLVGASSSWGKEKLLAVSVDQAMVSVGLGRGGAPLGNSERHLFVRLPEEGSI